MATKMAEMLASSAVKAAGAKLGAVLMDEAKLLWDLNNELQYMWDTLCCIQQVLKDAEGKSMANNARVTWWLKRLKSVACDIEDMLEEFTVLNPKEEVDGDNNCLVMVSLFCSSLFRSHISMAHQNISMAHQIETMRKRLSGIDVEARWLNFCPVDGNSHEDEVISTRDTISDINEDIVGRDTDKEQIISALLAESGDHVTVIAIYGFGGLGKTTLAKLAFNDATVAKYFDLRVWVYVSMKYDLKKIGESILSQVDEPTSYHTLEPLKQQIRKKLGDKKVLIVLDDLWEEHDEELGALMAFLKACAEGCRVMVTTRKEQIATKIQPALSHKLEVLSDEQCWDLFKQKVFSPGEDVHPEVEKIGRDLAKMCGGVPLAIRSLGSTMRSKKRVAAWERMRDSDIWKMEGEGSSSTGRILPSLRLSFYHLPGHLKPCFAYCSVFPKGCEIDKDLLIQQWIAMGFIQPTCTTTVLEKLGEEYIKELLGMSFLEVSRITFSAASKHARTPRAFQMHDLMHDLAVSALGEEFLLSDFGDRDMVNSRQNDCRYAVLANYRDASTIFETVPGKARSLHFRNCKQLQLPKKVSSLSKFLRVLDFSGCSIQELPAYITQQLKLLKFLDASGLQNPVPPEHLSSLCSLHTLNLSCSCLRSLPSHIGDLCKLHYLNLHNCSNLSELPGSFVQLKNLLHLDLSKCSSLQSLPTSFGNLQKLYFLNLSGCHQLHKLPESFTLLKNLEELILSECWELKELPASFGNLFKLRFLDMSHCIQLSELPVSLSELVNLECLDLSCCTTLWIIPGYYGNLKKLEVLNILYCDCLIRVPEGIADMYSLKNLLAIGMGKIFSNDEDDQCFRSFTGYKSVISFSEEDRSSDAEDMKTTNLAVTGLSMVRRIEEVAGLHLQKRQHIRRLKLDFHYCDSPVDHGLPENIRVLQKLLPARTLEQFELEGYNSIELPFWMKNVTSFLPNLVHLHFFDLERCDSLPPLGQLAKLVVLEICKMPNLRKVDMEFSGGHTSFHSLRVLKIENMKNLEEWHVSIVVDGGGIEVMFPNLHRIDITCCPRLKFVPFLPQCLSLDIKSSNATLMSGSPSAPLSPMATMQQISQEDAILTNNAIQKLESNNLVKLSLGNLKMIDRLPPLGQLPKLSKLRISKMPNIRQVGSDFSGCSTPFPRLRILEIGEMPNLEEWHTTQSTNDGDEHIFSVLEELVMRGCPKLRFVPFLPPCTSTCHIEDSDEVLLSGQYNGPPSYHMPTSTLSCRGFSAGFMGLRYFTVLKSLNIYDNKLEMMGSWGESIRRLTSLESLELSLCTVVGGEWFGALTSLRHLRISSCSLSLDFAQYVLHLTALKALELSSGWEAIKVLSKEQVKALTKQIPKVIILWCGPVRRANWENGVLTYCSFYKIPKSEWLSKNYNDAGVWPTILHGWPKEPEHDDGGRMEGKLVEDNHNGTVDEAGPSGTK